MPGPARGDVMLAVALAAAGLAATAGADSSAPAVVVVLFTLGYTLPLAVRRLFPVPVAAMTAGLALAFGQAVEDVSQPTLPLAVAVAAYTLGHELPARAAAGAGGLLLAGFAIAMAADGAPSGDLVYMAVIFGAPCVFGTVLRHRSEAAEQARQEAVDDERARIARELHDVVAHALTVVAVQAPAVRRRLEPHQEDEQAGLRALERTVREASAEMRRLLGVLRAPGDPAPRAPQPGLGQLQDLVGEARLQGLEVRSVLEPPPGGLSPGLELTAFRVVQEALTNVRRHAGARTVDVEVRADDGRLVVEVRDDGRGAGAPGEPGHGLAGMDERVRLYDGVLEAGPGDGGGFRVRAVLPLDRAPA